MAALARPEDNLQYEQVMTTSAQDPYAPIGTRQPGLEKFLVVAGANVLQFLEQTHSPRAMLPSAFTFALSALSARS